MFIENFRRLLFRGLVALLVSSAYAAGVPDDCTQLIVGIAPDWNSMRGQLQLFERSPGANWTPISPPHPVLFGKHGLAWGSGLAGQNENGLRKKPNATAARPPAFFRSAKSTPTTRSFRRALISRSIKSRRRMPGSMT